MLKKKHTHFRMWKSGKTWLFGATLLTVATGAGLLSANQGVTAQADELVAPPTLVATTPQTSSTNSSTAVSSATENAVSATVKGTSATSVPVLAATTATQTSLTNSSTAASSATENAVSADSSVTATSIAAISTVVPATVPTNVANSASVSSSTSKTSVSAASATTDGASSPTSMASTLSASLLDNLVTQIGLGKFTSSTTSSTSSTISSSTDAVSQTNTSSGSASQAATTTDRLLEAVFATSSDVSANTTASVSTASSNLISPAAPNAATLSSTSSTTNLTPATSSTSTASVTLSTAATTLSSSTLNTTTSAFDTTTPEDFYDLATMAYLVDSAFVNEYNSQNPTSPISMLKTGDIFTIKAGQTYKVVDTLDTLAPASGSATSNYPTNGFQGMAVAPVINGTVDLSRIIISFAASSSFTNEFWTDWVTNIESMIGGSTQYVPVLGTPITASQPETARAFAEAVMKQYSGASFAITGFSLGGYDALAVGAEDQIPVFAISGDDPSNILTSSQIAFVKANLKDYVDVTNVYDWALGDYGGDNLGARIYYDTGFILDPLFAHEGQFTFNSAGQITNPVSTFLGPLIDTIASFPITYIVGPLVSIGTAVMGVLDQTIVPLANAIAPFLGPIPSLINDGLSVIGSIMGSILNPGVSNYMKSIGTL